MKIIRREYLGIYIYANPKTKSQKALNKSLLEKVETIRCQRYERVVSERYDLFDQTTSKRDFLAYYKRILANRSGMGIIISKIGCAGIPHGIYRSALGVECFDSAKL